MNSQELDDRIDALFSVAPRRRVDFGRCARHAALPTAVAVAAFLLLATVGQGVDAPARVQAIAATLLVVAILVAAAAWAPLSVQPGVAMVIGLVLAGISVALHTRYGPLGASAATLPAAISAGFVLAALVQRLLWVIPLAIGVAINDVQSFYGGITRDLLESPDALARGMDQAVEPMIVAASAGSTVAVVGGLDAIAVGEVLLMRLPTLGDVWLLGVVDVLFAAAFLAVAYNFHLSVRRTTVALSLGFLATTLVAEPVPVLPFFAVAFVAAHLQVLRRNTGYALRRMLYPETGF